MSNIANLRQDIDGTGKIEMAWQNEERIKKKSVEESLGHYERKQHMLWADEDSLKFVERRNESILQWLQELTQMNTNKYQSSGKGQRQNW
jgi:hypothetical protein